MISARTLAVGCAVALGSFALIGCQNDMDRGEGMGAQDSRDKAGVAPGSTGTMSAPGAMRSSGPGGSNGVGTPDGGGSGTMGTGGAVTGGGSMNGSSTGGMNR